MQVSKWAYWERQAVTTTVLTLGKMVGGGHTFSNWMPSSYMRCVVGNVITKAITILVSKLINASACKEPGCIGLICASKEV